MNANAACIDPQARLCLLRHIHALKHGLSASPCRKCEPAAEVVAILRDESRPKTKVEPQANVKALPVPVAAAPQVVTPPVLDGLDLGALRKVLRPLLLKQDKSGQKSVYIERLLSLYNPAAPKGTRFGGKRRFSQALVSVPEISMQGAYVLLDAGARSLCMGEAGKEAS